MEVTRESIERIINHKKARLENLSNPDIWWRYTKNMECGEVREFKQSCIDDEIIISALTYVLKSGASLTIQED